MELNAVHFGPTVCEGLVVAGDVDFSFFPCFGAFKKLYYITKELIFFHMAMVHSVHAISLYVTCRFMSDIV